MTLVIFPLTARADNPIVQTVYTADPAPLVVDDTLYVYTSHDEDGSDWYVMNDWKCYSTKDMVNWTDHGTVFSLKGLSWAKSDAWAAQCVARNGKYYLYVPVTSNEGKTVVGVAVADSPAGPFKDPIGEPLVSTGLGDIDPTVFVDDDGQAYLYWGNPNLYYVKLNEDMVSYDKSDTKTNTGIPGVTKVELTPEGFGTPREPDRETQGVIRKTSYEEAPWFYKRGDKYYMIYAANMPEDLAYATSSSPTGPWTYGGTVMKTDGTESFTNHPGIVDFQGKSYLFYHTGKLSGGGGFTRSVAVEEFSYNKDGSIPLINWTENGPNAIAALNPYARNEAETIAWTEIKWDGGKHIKKGVQTESHMEGEDRGVHVSNIHNGNSVKVKNVDFGTEGAAAFTARAACAQEIFGSTAGGSIELWIDADNAENKKKIGDLTIGYSGGEFVDFSTNITEEITGIHDLTFLFKGQEGFELFTFDSWQFIPKSETVVTVALEASLDHGRIDKTEGKNTSVLTVKAIKSDGSVQDVTQTAQVSGFDAEIVEYSNGSFTGKTYGRTTATVAYDGKEAKIPILVRDGQSEEVESLEIQSVKQTLEVGKSSKVTVQAVFKDGRKEDVTEYADYENLTPLNISFANNTIKGVGKGIGTIRATFRIPDGKAVSAELSVEVIKSAIAGKELIKNGDFSDGTNNWKTNYGDGISAREDENGECYLEVASRSNNYSGPVQAVTGNFKAGDVLHFSYRMKSESAENQQHPRFVVKYLDGDLKDAEEEKQVVSGLDLKNEWITVTGDYVIEADATQLEFYIHENQWNPDANTFYLADVSVKLQVMTSEELIKNGDFSDGTNNWGTNYGDGITAKEDGNGGFYLEVAQRGNNFAGPVQTVTGEFKTGQVLHFSYRMKSESAENQQKPRLAVKYLDGDLKDAEEDKEIVSDLDLKNEWITVTGTYVIEADATQLQFCIDENQWNPSANTFYLADVSVKLQKPVELNGIAIKTPPTKTDYKTGEELDLSGMVVTATYSDGSTEDIMDTTQFSVHGYDKNTEGTQTVIVAYEGETAEFQVTVKEEVIPVTLTGIKVKTKPAKTTYKTGEELDLSGMVLTATYSDRSTKDITDMTQFTVSGYDKNKEGSQTITVTYEGKTAEFQVTVKEEVIAVTLTGIKVKTQPAKTTYKTGEELDLSGMVLTATYSDGSTKDITDTTQFTVSGYDKNKEGSQTITVTYEGKTAEFQVTVTEEGLPVTLTGIEVKTLPAKTAYKTGEELDLSGMVVMATYSDGSTKDITDTTQFTVSGYDKNKEGSQTITVTYEGKTAEFQVTVTEEGLPVTLMGIKVKTQPAKTTYKTGEKLDLSGMVVTATYSDGSTKDITDTTQFTVSGYDKNKEGSQTITVTYKGKTAKFQVKVTKVNRTKKVSSIRTASASYKIAAGKKLNLSKELIIAPKNATNKKVTYKITKNNNKKWAVLNSKGSLTTKKKGAGKTITVTIKAKDGSGKKRSVKITIMKNAVTKISFKKKTMSVKAGRTVKLKAIVNTNGRKANKKLAWSSSKTKYATVNSKGKVTTKKAGIGKTVKITAKATDGTGRKATIKIKIKK